MTTTQINIIFPRNFMIGAYTIIPMDSVNADDFTGKPLLKEDRCIGRVVSAEKVLETDREVEIKFTLELDNPIEEL